MSAGIVDREGWPLRAGQRVRVAGVQAVPGGHATRSWTGTVELIGDSGHAAAIYVRDDRSGALRATLPKRCCILRQSKAEREEMVGRLRRQAARSNAAESAQPTRMRSCAYRP